MAVEKLEEKPPLTARFEVALACLEAAQNKPAEAETRFARALATLEAAFGQGHWTAAAPHMQIANAYRSAGEVEKAAEHEAQAAVPGPEEQPGQPGVTTGSED